MNDDTGSPKTGGPIEAADSGASAAPSSPGPSAPEGKGSEESAQTQDLRQTIIDALRTVFDPEIPVNVYDIGLIYDIDIDASSAVNIRMTLTSPACPVAGTLPGEVEARAKDVPGVSAAKVELVWEPTWTMEMMSEEAKLQLGMM